MYEFKINSSSTSVASFPSEWSKRLKGYNDNLRSYFLHLKNPTINQLYSDTKFGLYNLRDMLESGQPDNHGCLKPKMMKKLRENY